MTELSKAGTVSEDLQEITCPHYAFLRTAVVLMLLDGLPEVFPPQGTSWSTEKFASTGETNAATGIQISEYETAVDSTCTTLANPRPAVSDIVETDEVSL